MHEEVVMATGVATCLTGSVSQTNETMQIINLVITCVVGVVTLAYTIYKWYKKAKSDGKITKEEVNELIEDVKEEINELNDK